MKKTILINAFGENSWIGGLYYRKNIAFELLQNDYIRKNYNVLIYCHSRNVDIFDDLKEDVIIRHNSISNKIIQKALKSIYVITYRIIAEFPITRDKKYLGMTSISWIPDFQHKKYPSFFDDEEKRYRDEKYTYCGKSLMPLVLSSKDSLQSFYEYYGIKKKNIYVVPFVSFINKIIRGVKDDENTIIEKYKLHETIYAVVMNQFWQHKNHIVVFEAIKKCFENNPKLNLKVIFTGKMEDYRNPDYITSLSLIAEEEVVSSHIEILGFISRTEQIALMKNAAFVIQPSLFEGWGTVVEDAKVLDKTILLSDIPVHREQMNEKCILFDPHDSATLAELIYQESQKEHHDDIEKGIADMYARAKEYSKGFEQLLKDLEKKR